MLSKLEDQILITVCTLKNNAYGVSIYQHLIEVTGSTIALGVVYANLDRLERKGYLSSYLGEPTAVRGGMRKKYFSVTPSGLRALEESKQVHDKIWREFASLSIAGGETQ